MLRVPPAYYRSRDPIHNLKIKVSIRKTHQKRSTKAKVVGRGDDDEKQADESDSSSEDSSSSEDGDELERASSDEPNSSDDEDEIAEKNRRHEAKVKKKKEERDKARAKKKAAKKKRKEERRKGPPRTEKRQGVSKWTRISARLRGRRFLLAEKEFSPRELLLYRPKDHDDGEKPKRKRVSITTLLSVATSTSFRYAAKRRQKLRQVPCTCSHIPTRTVLCPGSCFPLPPTRPQVSSMLGVHSLHSQSAMRGTATRKGKTGAVVAVRAVILAAAVKQTAATMPVEIL